MVQAALSTAPRQAPAPKPTTRRNEGTRAGAAKPARPTRRRPLVFSRLARVILASHLIGLVVLLGGVSALSRYQSGLIEFQTKALSIQAELMTAVMADTATGFGAGARLDAERARDVLREVSLPEGWRVRLFDRSGELIADTATLDSAIEVEALAPIPAEPPPPPTNWERMRQWWGENLNALWEELPWEQAQRERLRRDLKSDMRAALEGQTRAGAAFTEDDTLIVSITQPVRRVQNVLGALTLESGDLDSIVGAEREALLPVAAVALAAALLSSLALTVAIALPLRRLARAAETVTKSARKRDAIPDLSRRRDDIGELSVRMREMSAGLYDRIDDVANFAADVAHEIKNPLTSLRSASDTLGVAKTEAQRHKLIGIIQEDVGRVNRLITDISAASKVDADLARDTAEVVDVARLAGDLVDFYHSTTGPDAPRVRYFGPGEGELFIRAFATPFAQVLRNLVDNAITFSPPGGEVRITAEGTAGEVVMSVDDDGPGIPESALQTVFERFYTDRTEQKQEWGNHSGLGLTICRQIVAAHRGTIRAENRRAHRGGPVLGARFVVSLPRVRRGGVPKRGR